jgi:ketosteroid isomerase-like protein
MSTFRYGSANGDECSTRERRSVLLRTGAGMLAAAGATLCWPATAAAAADETEALQLARQWIDRLNRRDMAGLTAILADDFLYTAKALNPPEFRLHNNRDKFLKEVRDTGVGSRFKKLVRMKVVSELGAGNRAVLETEGYSELDDGFVYANVYCFNFWTDGGKITAIHDYCCTHTAWLLLQHMKETSKPAAAS